MESSRLRPRLENKTWNFAEKSFKIKEIQFYLVFLALPQCPYYWTIYIAADNISKDYGFFAAG